MDASDLAGLVLGVDVSHYQGRVDWALARAGGVQFAYCKASEGEHDTDSTFKANVRGCAAAGLYVGAYHFLTAGVPAAKQLENFLAMRTQVAELLTLPCALDLERGPGGQLPTAAQALEFLTLGEGRGLHWLVYTNLLPPSQQDPRLARFALWQADPTPPRSALSQLEPRPCPPWRSGDWGVWQCAFGARGVPGFSAPVDLNVARAAWLTAAWLTAASATVAGGMLAASPLPQGAANS